MSTAVPTPLLQQLHLTYDDGETHLVEVVRTYTDGSFDVRPTGTRDPEWTVYPSEITNGVVTIREVG